jgi:hypothetical protein
MPGERGQRGEALRVLGRVRVVQRKRWGQVVLPLGNHVGDPKAQIREALRRGWGASCPWGASGCMGDGGNGRGDGDRVATRGNPGG